MIRQPESEATSTFEEMATLFFAPVLRVSAENVEQPAVRAFLKAVIALQERGKEALAQLEEAIEDLRAEVEAELAEEGENTPALSNQENSVFAQMMIKGMSELDTSLRKATQGTIDARSLLSILFAALALRQLILKGFQFDDVPWYVLAWYAFDSFIKLHDHQPLMSKENSTATREHHDNGNSVTQVRDSPD
ncbi:hypothetical protein PCC7418_3030 [Halothece sp. PCC 7418]|uniref:DUF5132 domain-containing protein n=1 Tax=Halothece sp. (strain PCC 7418) TaxID=65093 RepID=UPI0002A07090|nr:DUF5132 domain-containing protein [Halothece sp. PCC 7418]AFZ45153.1 hypothetical protein PCC7418_3030 [Halothece sp. PCC 7418]